MSEDQKLIAVVGATGAQGGSVVRALRDRGTFRVRALTRNPSAYTGDAAEVAEADLSRPETLATAFAGAHGVFVVTNFWEPGSDEIAQGRAAVDAAVAAGVQHFVWSTLPNVEELTAGQFHVPHFTNKAKVDEIVRDAGFASYTFVQPPFYLENLNGVMAPQRLPDGRQGWALPLPTDAKVVHMGTISDLGGVVAGVFENPDQVGQGSYLSPAAGLFSFGDVVATLNSQGHNLAFVQVPADLFATFFSGAEEMAQMMGYWQQNTYLGENGNRAMGLAREITTTQITDLPSWTAINMPPPAQDPDMTEDSSTETPG